MLILSHRGYKLGQNCVESSFEAIEYHFKNGRGIEIDLNFSKDKKIFFFHDSGLKRITNNNNQSLFKDLTIKEINNINICNNHFCDWDKFIFLVEKYNPPMVAIHYKGVYQNIENTKILIKNLKKKQNLLKKILIFDLKITTGKKIKREIPKINLALSIAHSYDIKRFNKFVSKTLYPIKTAIKYKKIFSWVWLDEWDRTNNFGKTKSLYNQKNFNLLKNNLIKIALVTPELHSTSPGLYGGESHQDNKKVFLYNKRLKQITKLEPNAICSDNTDLF